MYDCSCKQSPTTLSINNCLHPGPPFLNDLSAIFLRFRQHRFAFLADIKKAFLHVYLDKADRDSTCFLWLSDHTDEHSPFITCIYPRRMLRIDRLLYLILFLVYCCNIHACAILIRSVMNTCSSFIPDLLRTHHYTSHAPLTM